MNAPLVATLIANPNHGGLEKSYAEAACVALGAKNMDWLAPDIACDIEIPPSAFFTADQIRDQLKKTLRPAKVDMIVQPSANRKKRALIADMDSTMIDQECIDELAERAGLKPQIASITARAMNGEIDFESALRERVSLLSGLSSDVIDEVIETQITLASGGETLVSTMKGNDAYCALVSGGFTAFTQSIAAKLGFDENRANVLMTEEGKLTGKVREPILGQQAKVDALNDICAKQQLSPHDFIAVGDGANDLAMLSVAASGVALHAKPKVAESAKMRVDHGDLTALLYIQGYRQRDFVC